MAKPRDVSHPIVRTYIDLNPAPSGKSKIHVRLYSPEHGLDRRGTGRNLQQAINKARKNVPRAK